MRFKNLLTALGFFCFIIGMLSIFLGIVGVYLSFLSPLEKLGNLPAFLIKLALAVGGLVLAYLARTDWERSE